ncbi:hypothetical protein BDZ89DRAFT_481070 [Hymenopellis radicata]|nr:hypothetical protein BDZ89DRAFT_481070 [Hymenopellis radicata]
MTDLAARFRLFRGYCDSFALHSILDMVLLIDLPVEVLTLTLGHLHDENVSLTSVSLAGNRALTAIAQNLMLRDLRICLKLPIDSGHRFYPTFRRICNTHALRNAVRSVTFKCRSELDNLDLLPLLDLLRKYFLKLTSVTHVHIRCIAHCPDRHGTCLTPTLLISVLRLPALRTLVVDNCIINHHVIPDSLRCRSLRTLILNASTSKRVPFYSQDPPPHSLLKYTPAVSVIEMMGVEFKDNLPMGYESCLSGVFKWIVPGVENNLDSRQPRRMHLVCECEADYCLYRPVIARLCTALKSFKVLEELVFDKDMEWGPLEAAHHSFTELSLAGRGVLKRLSLNFGISGYDKETPYICEALQRLSNLEEVTLECDGTDEDLLACIAAHPSLRCVYFHDAPLSDPEIQDLAQRIAQQARQLTLVAWVPVDVMAQMNADRTIEMKEYEEPRWLQFGGEDTKWWEESRF